MRQFIITIGLFAAAISTARQAQADVLNTSTRRLELVSFDIDATETPLQRPVGCTPEQTQKSVINMVSFGHRDNNLRDLIPSFRPLDNQASWMLNTNECPSLAPAVNGIGFESFDAGTGDAVLYLAEFDAKALSRDAYIHRALIMHPIFTVTNVNRFSAKCGITYPGIFGRLGRPELTCNLTNVRGVVRFGVFRS